MKGGWDEAKAFEPKNKMAEYLSPGVYVEEFESGMRPMEGVSTSTAGFVGMAEIADEDMLKSKVKIYRNSAIKESKGFPTVE